MKTVQSRQDLVVWADPKSLAEAKSVFSPYEAAIRPIPSVCRSRDLPDTRISIVYLKHSEPKEHYAAFLECFRNSKVEFLLFYMPDDSSTLAFRWGEMVGRHRVEKADWIFNWQELRQILRARNIFAHPSANIGEDFDLVAARKRLGLTQAQMARALKVAPRTVQNWESGDGRSQMPKKTQDLREFLELMDEYVIASNEEEWLNTPLPAIRNVNPIHAILEGKIRDLIVEFLRLGEGQPV